jgi:response regulator RpfG family c-di-GMP phosphodiesterase
VWDALLDNRAYRPSWPHDQVKAYLRQHAGTLFDPVVVATFLRLLDAEDAVSRPAPAASARGTAPLTPPR